VDRAIARNVETKRIIYDSNFINFNPAISQQGDMLPILPSVSQGDTSYQRSGTKIKIKKLVIRGHLCWTGNTSPGFQKIGVRQLIVKNKLVPNQNASFAYQQLPALLEGGGGSYKDFNGETSDLHSPIYNKMWAKARDRKIFMYQKGSDTSTDDLHKSVSFFTIDLKQARNKIINYTSESGAVSNFGWWMLLGWVRLDGGVNPSTNTNLGCEYVVDMTYEDA